MVQERGSPLRFPTQLFVVALVLTLATLGWVFWNSNVNYRHADASRLHDLRVEELRGVILHLDEVMTMSARMAAATGDLRWEARYHEAEPKLDAAIKEAMALAPGDSALRGSTQTDAANAKLVAMETQAFALVRGGRPQDARAVLFAPVYEEQKALYAAGTEAVLADVRARVDANLQDYKRRAVLSMGGSATLLGLSIVVACCCGYFLRRAVIRLAGLVGQMQQSGLQVNTSVTEIAATAREQQATASEIASLYPEGGLTRQHSTSSDSNYSFGPRRVVLAVGLLARRR